MATLMMMVFLPMTKSHRTEKVVRCPDAGQPAQILVDTGPWYRFRKMRASIRNCSLWPKRRGCTESCLESKSSSERLEKMSV
jgi:hypothetical protein